MRKRRKRQSMPAPLELLFYHSFLRLSEGDQRLVVEELGKPFRRLWLIVDAQGVRRLEDTNDQ